jgi:predicted nucleic acid-binding Zn ribbon protein
LQAGGIQFFINGNDLTDDSTTSVMKVKTGMEHAVEIVASRPFKGALIRFESEASEFTFIPEINAQEAIACILPIKGITHRDKKLKNALSGSFRTDSNGYFSIDVTVVDYNNATGSAYWYSQYTIRAMEEHFPTVAPFSNPHHEATTSFPTYTEKCHACGSEKFTIGFPSAKVLYKNNIGTCQELADDAAMGLIPPEFCEDVQTAIAESCSCIAAPTPSVVVAGVRSSDRVTFEPTYATPYSTVTSFPTYAEKCHVCGEGNQVTDPNALVRIESISEKCGDLEMDGLDGYIPPEACSTIQTVAQASCGCSPMTISPSPSLSLLSGQSTYLPTVTPFPTMTSEPSYSGVCNVCYEEGFRIQHPENIVTIADERLTCKELQMLADKNLIPPEICDRAQTVAMLACECANPGNIPAPAPLSPRSYQKGKSITLRPTVTAEPTVSFAPSFSERCRICHDDDSVVTNVDATVIIDGLEISCGQLYETDLLQMIPPVVCPQARVVAIESCGCSAVAVPLPNPALSKTDTLSPTITPMPTITAMPTYADKCYVCGGESFSVVDPLKTLKMGGMVVLCGELEEAGRSGHIRPDLCEHVQDKANLYCGCSSLEGRSYSFQSSVSPSPPVQTFSPTITALPTHTPAPTFVEKCWVCGDESSQVTNSSETFVLEGLKVDCETIQEMGATGHLTPELCPKVKETVTQVCGCQNNTSISLATTVSAPPTMIRSTSAVVEPSRGMSLQCCLLLLSVLLVGAV